MARGKQIKTLEELHDAAFLRRAVYVPGCHPWSKRIPAAFMINQIGGTLYSLFSLGMFIYEKPEAAQKEPPLTVRGLCDKYGIIYDKHQSAAVYHLPPGGGNRLFDPYGWHRDWESEEGQELMAYARGLLREAGCDISDEQWEENRMYFSNGGKW